MPLLRLIAEGVGPFERLDLDFSDGHGNPHLGPHILAGVNGSGKSTALRAIAWAMYHPGSSFDLRDWQHFLAGHDDPRAIVLLQRLDGSPAQWACTKAKGELFALIRLAEMRGRTGVPDEEGVASFYEELGYKWERTPPARGFAHGLWFSLAAYASSRDLKHLERPDQAEKLGDAFSNCLAFGSTVNNEGIHRWLVDLFSRRAIAKERGQPTEPYERSLERLQSALKLVCGQDVGVEVDIDPTLQLHLRVFGQSLNFSQLPDGVRNTVGWLADFMMRQDLMQWDPALKGKRPGILLLDEVDAHLHPRWQRTVLPAMRAALPDVQIIVTSHSPFVISSCARARVHVLELDERTGRARALPPVDAPFGGSIMATLKDIFGVSSRFDVDTEKKLEEWNELSRQEAVGPLSRADARTLEKLTAELAERSEELRSIVGVRQPPGRNSKSKPSKRRERMAG
jgi:hypothetical protein